MFVTTSMNVFRISILFMLLAVQVHAQDEQVEKIGTKELMELLNKQNDTTYVVNFWATWCSPCVKEIPYFQELMDTYADRKLQVILVSMDFPNQLEKRVQPFLRDKDIALPVYLMTNMDYNSWIDRVEPGWSGAIPATLFYKRSSRIFFEQEFEKDILFTRLEQFMKNNK